MRSAFTVAASATGLQTLVAVPKAALLVLVLICAATSSSCANKKNSQHIDSAALAPPLAAAGLPVSLPRTRLNVDLTIVKKSKSPGLFCQYDDLFFRGVDLNVACTPDHKSTTKTTVTAFAVNSIGVPDPDRTYLLPPAAKAGWAIDTASSVELSEGGLLNSVSNDRTNRRAEVVISILSAIAGVFTGAINPTPPAAALKKQKVASPQDQFEQEFLKNSQLIYNFEQLDESRRTALVDLFQKNDSSLIAARAAYKSLEDLHASYLGLLGGAGAQGAATLITESRGELENQANLFFLGKSDVATWSPSFEVEPDSNVPTMPTITSALALIGDCGAALPTGSDPAVRLVKNPPPPDIACDSGAPIIPVAVALAVPVRPSFNVGDFTQCVDNNKVLKGIPFASPADVMVSLNNAPTLPSQRIQIAQWGKTSCLTLPGSSFTVAVTYFESTGAIKSAKFTNTSLITKDSVAALSGIAGDVQKSLNDAKAKAQDDAKNKDLNDLKARREVLDERVNILKDCQALNIQCDF